MSQELWMIEKCDHGETRRHRTDCWAEKGRHELSPDCVCLGGSLTILDFDTIWDRYYEAADRRNHPGLTADELRKVIGLESDT